MFHYTDYQLREAFHFHFLERLLAISEPKFYALKGGVNLRFFFGSPRYSEDMDLDVFGVSVDTLKKNGYKILEDSSFKRLLGAYGIEELRINDQNKSKQTATTQRFRLRLVTSNGEELPTKVEFSRRTAFEPEQVSKALIRPEIAQAYKRLSFYCLHYNADYAVMQKVLALGGRTETQARDVFDLYLLYLGGNLQAKILRPRLSKSVREEALLALISLDFDAYRAQVVEYLEPEKQAEFGTRQVWDEMCDKIMEILDESQ